MGEDSNQRNPVLSVIIVNYNGGAMLRDCLLSLQNSVLDFPVEILVVDNSSCDGSPDMVQREFPLVKLVQCSENRGYARANNLGVRKSCGQYLVFLNPDTSVTPQALSILLKEIRDDPEASGVGPALLVRKGVYQVSFGRKVNFFSELLKKMFLNFYFRRILRMKISKREVGWLSGACLLTKRNIVERVGLFDEDFFLYFEDIDLCFRIRQEKGRLFYIPEAEVFHKGGAITSERKLQSRYFYRKSQIYFYRKHNSILSLNLLRLYLLVCFCLLFLGRSFRGQRDKSMRQKFFRLLKQR